MKKAKTWGSAIHYVNDDAVPYYTNNYKTVTSTIALCKRSINVRIFADDNENVTCKKCLQNYEKRGE